ncbi:MAG: esterase [Pusillimonas sp.]|nr:esterase [Pusillimonas sp.]MBC41158.1 esterase [Pusillimonas sp.]HCP76164.1 esterase [Pusillimonas sp.]|tara:strand:+ start:110 stop:721 length:612 start_codon:yes stop_codon:yes gene_type:complete
MILYLHGFRSSPYSTKAQMLAKEMARLGLADAWYCPQLPASPKEAIDLCDNLISQGTSTPSGRDRSAVIVGSSLGGFYAQYLAQKWSCRAVLLNPVIDAARDLAVHTGKHTQYHSQETFEFHESYLQELTTLKMGPPRHPSRFFLMATTGDEVLNWKEMVTWYAGCASRIISGSDHGIHDFAHWMPEVTSFILDSDLSPQKTD